MQERHYQLRLRRQQMQENDLLEYVLYPNNPQHLWAALPR
jgi:hypothetical protein